MKNPLLILFIGMGSILGAFIICFCLVAPTEDGFDTLTIISGVTLAVMGLFLWWWCRRMIKQYPLSTDKKSKK